MPPIIKLAAAAVIAANATQDGSSALDQRFAPNPSLQANLAFRVILAVLSTVFCWVPFRLLCRNGDVAPVTLIVVLACINFFTVLNSIIWSTDNWDVWWDGTGLCDIEVYLQQPLYTAYAASIFAIIYRLAQQVKVARVTQPSRAERAHMARIQAAIIVPVPLFQLFFTFFDISQRYKIGTLVGCLPVYDVSWPRVVVYEVPNPVFVFASVPFAFLAWKRYRAIVKESKDALPSNSNASARARQARCRLYNMSLSILIVYLPVSIYFMVQTLQGAAEASFKPYSFNRIHHGNNPYPWDAILFVPSWLLQNSVINQPWIPISTSIVIIAFFGTTKDGLDMYRRYAVALGLARLFPKLRESRDGPPNRNDVRHLWIELKDLGNKKDKCKGKAVGTGRSRRSNPYPALDTGTDTSFGPEPLLQAPARRPLPPTPLTPSAPLSEQLLLRLEPSSPLQSSRVIDSMIPERASSLGYQQYRYRISPQQAAALRGATEHLPRISEFPHRSGVAAGRDIVSPWVSGARASVRDDRRVGNNNPPISPALPAPSSTLAWLNSPSALYRYENSSPRAAAVGNDDDSSSAMHKTSRDAVQPRDVIDDGWGPGEEFVTWSQQQEASTSAAPAPTAPTDVSWPFLRGTAHTSETPSATPSPTPSPTAMTASESGTGSGAAATAAIADVKGKGKAKAKVDEEEEFDEELVDDGENSFTRHRDDPPDPDPWDSPPIRLAPGLEAIRPRQGRRVRIPRTTNVQFDQYIKPKKGKDSEDPESK